jgi:hypothetical protein
MPVERGMYLEHCMVYADLNMCSALVELVALRRVAPRSAVQLAA